MQLDNLLKEIDELSLNDIERHRLRLQNAERILSKVQTNRTAPTDLLNSYIELTAIIEGFRLKNPSLDLSVYDNALAAMRNAIGYMENAASLYEQNDYLTTMNQTHTRMIADLQTELMQYTGIEAAIYNGTLATKIKTVLKKIRS